MRRPVLRSARLARTIDAAFACDLEPLAVDAVILQLAEGLIEEADAPASEPRLNLAAVDRARAFLDAANNRVVHSSELGAATGLSRFELARQFRLRLGTSPYRYSLMRRLEFARDCLAGNQSTVNLALDAGFADQAHFTRLFKSTFGLTPARYAALRNRSADA